jgi:hypothetical protein
MSTAASSKGTTNAYPEGWFFHTRECRWASLDPEIDAKLKKIAKSAPIQAAVAVVGPMAALPAIEKALKSH